jgi:hypothetical protein
MQHTPSHAGAACHVSCSGIGMMFSTESLVRSSIFASASEDLLLRVVDLSYVLAAPKKWCLPWSRVTHFLKGYALLLG